MELRGISKDYSGVPALTDVSLQIRSGEVHALLGENGAGKSTLMNVASGTVAPTKGDLLVHGNKYASLTPALAAELGIAIVHQHPAVLKDLTVLENLQVALPSSIFKGASPEKVGTELLARVGLKISLKLRVEDLSIAQKHLLEIAKALATSPKILVLDEPTAALGQDSVELLFQLVAKEIKNGTAVIYITHRLAEVRELADIVTVLRDGHLMATSKITEVTDAKLLSQIIGRELASAFPAKKKKPAGAKPNLVVSGLSGDGFTDINIEAYPGQIIGIAGVVGNGQSQLIKALSGQAEFNGTVTVNGVTKSARDLNGKAALMPADRQREGVMMRMSVRENSALSSLKKFKNLGLLSRKKEVNSVHETLTSLSIKAPSLEAPVSALSGGNQQKVVMARALLSDPLMILADEPTQGVDVGARSDLYEILRKASADGIPVVVASSDAKELEGLCDTVYVLSRGQVVKVLQDGENREKAMIEAAVTSTTKVIRIEREQREQKLGNETFVDKFRRFLRGDYAPPVMLAIVMVALALYILPRSDTYLGDFNISSILLLVSALGFVAIGQTTVMMTGGIDLSSGPLIGFLVVIASFFINDEAPLTAIILGLVTMAVVAALVGLINSSLIRFVKFTAIAATLTTYIAIGGFAFILRPEPGGYISIAVSEILNATLGPIPYVFIVLVIATLGMEHLLRKSRWGWQLRAVGSNEESARQVGVKTTRTIIGAYVIASLFVFLGATLLMVQLGIGDASQGVTYTLSGITAVVLGGTSLMGGRGTYVGTLMGAVLLIQVLNATVFLDLDQTWQYLLQAALILLAAVIYSLARGQKIKLKRL
ncbi:MAG: ATP-binding cassette domain-containing protein [Actinobacteria bacterium]|nr:ATP-binding cassette domain-containing protein [Actinomycetota bacterium]MTA92242.1 ATP-binding cassette domain-containing protein [Actinomycetota bacterium]